MGAEMAMLVGLLVRLGLNITSTTGCITVRLSADIHASQRMDPPEFDDSLTFPSFHNGGI